MRAATMFSGIGAPETARPDWQWLWSAEIEPFPAAVLAARHPASINLGDVTAHGFAERALAVGRPDVLVFGSPCQSFSIAGKRLGLDDPRGNLALVALAVVRRVRPRWLIFENVPGLLSSGGGDDFAAFLAAVQECGYLGCWRVLDAQYWSVAQRRERVFFVGCFGDWRGPAEVLSLAESLRGHPPPRREAGEGVARPLARGTESSGGYRNDADTADNLIVSVYALDLENLGDGGNVGWRGPHEPTITLNTNGNIGVGLSQTVRRLLPIECERLQGFPDQHTAIIYRGKPAADGPRYKSLGNSMAVPVLRWLLTRLEAVDAALAPAEQEAA